MVGVLLLRYCRPRNLKEYFNIQGILRVQSHHVGCSEDPSSCRQRFARNGFVKDVSVPVVTPESFNSETHTSSLRAPT